MKRNTWHLVDHHSDILVGQYIVPNFVSNSVSIQIAENEFILYSPGKALLENWPYRHIEGLTLHIIMPNAYHFMGVDAWKKCYPNAILYASKAAIKQLYAKKAFLTSDPILALEEVNSFLPDNYACLFPPGHRAGDVWLKKTEKNTHSSLWVTCDSFLNYDRLSNQPLARFMQKLLGAAPGLKMSQVVKWFILTDRKKFKAWALERALKDKPTTLIPSHGEVSSANDLTNDLVKLLKDRL